MKSSGFEKLIEWLSEAKNGYDHRDLKITAHNYGKTKGPHIPITYSTTWAVADAAILEN